MLAKHFAQDLPHGIRLLNHAVSRIIYENLTKDTVDFGSKDHLGALRSTLTKTNFICSSTVFIWRKFHGSNWFSHDSSGPFWVPPSEPSHHVRFGARHSSDWIAAPFDCSIASLLCLVLERQMAHPEQENHSKPLWSKSEDPENIYH